MREERVIALAGLLQAVASVRAVATLGSCDAAAMRPCLVSVFKIDAATPADVFGGIGNLRLGLETLIVQIDDDKRDMATTRLAVSVLRSERKLAARASMLSELRSGIQRIEQQSALDAAADDVLVRVPALAQLYVETISKLQPRIVVEGDPQCLRQDALVAQIRALLLAAIRAAVLWRQLGGSHWRLLFRRQQYAMLARGLLAQCTLSGS